VAHEFDFYKILSTLSFIRKDMSELELRFKLAV